MQRSRKFSDYQTFPDNYELRYLFEIYKLPVTQICVFTLQLCKTD